MGGRFLPSAKRLEHDRYIIVAFRNAPVQRDRLADQFDRSIVSTDLVGEDAKQLQPADVVGVGSYDAPI